MFRVILSVILLSIGGMVFAQEASTNAAPAPAVVEAKKYPEPIALSAMTRFHYDVSFVSNGNSQKWGNFNFWYLTLKAQANITENLKGETSIDMGYFSGQRGITNIETGKALLIERLIETAYLQYKLDPAFVITAGRFWEYYAPWVYSQQTRDGVGLSGSVLNGMLKYGLQIFNDSILYSPYTPLLEAQIGVMPVKGITLDGAMYFAGNGETNKKTGISGNLFVRKCSVLPDLVVMNEFAYTITTVGTNTVNAYDNFTLIGWQIGTVQPFLELYLGDKNIDAAVTNDNSFSARLAAKWDVTPNFAVVPYLMYTFIRNGTTTPEPLGFRLRLDCKF